MRIYHSTGSFIQRTAWLPLRVAFRLLQQVEYRGTEHLRDLRGPAIFAANHTSESDPLLIVSALPAWSRHLPLVFVSREKDFYQRLGWQRRLYGGFFFKLMAALPARTGLRDYDRSLAHHFDALACGRSVCIFPVGKKHDDRDIGSAKGGATYLAARSGRPIVPVRITKPEPARAGTPRSKERLVITFGPPLPMDQLANDPQIDPGSGGYERAAVELMKRIIALRHPS